MVKKKRRAMDAINVITFANISNVSVELALWERAKETEKERSGETTSKRSGGELRSERERVKFHTLMPKKRRTMER
ncbi:unnamed protein product [Linum trigynum]|uniref:Uncharacterized protein n=1 Tax=Linum trigynum TaxID=586398 RepID=A0AAV2FXW4_9ROSI